MVCPKCGYSDIEKKEYLGDDDWCYWYTCLACLYSWDESEDNA